MAGARQFPREAPLYRTAIQQLGSQLLPGEATSLESLEMTSEELGRRLQATGCAPLMAVTYASRLRCAIARFKAATSGGGGSPLSLDAEISEALLALARWPRLRDRLLPVINAVVREQAQAESAENTPG